MLGDVGEAAGERDSETEEPVKSLMEVLVLLVTPGVILCTTSDTCVILCTTSDTWCHTMYY